jgi:hypothetical protein
MKFNVPYYSQTADFTCGPACVLMVMKHFEPELKIGRELEFEVWRQCNMLGVRGADPYGLSVPLIDAGHTVRLITEWKRIVDVKPWRRRLKQARIFTQEEVELTFLGIKENRRKALNRGLAVQFKRPLVEDIIRGVRTEFVPIALVHMGVVHSLNIPHWVVVTDADEERVLFNDPYPPKGHKGIKLPPAKFQKILDDIGTRIGMSPSVLFVRR